MDPLSFLINKSLLIPSQKTNYIAVEMHYLSMILKEHVATIFVDDEWYSKKYPDVLMALNEGAIKTVTDHYIMFGYYEHRMPYAIHVDEEWYLSEYDDVRKAVELRTFGSGQAHFDETGYREGRFPYAHFCLRLRGDMAQ